MFDIEGQAMGYGKYSNQQKDSTWTYFQNGKVISTIDYKLGKREGKKYTFYEDGKVYEETTFENDCTASSYYCMLADNLASITTFYYANYENAYICVNKVMHCVTQHLTYYDDCSIAENLLANTVLADADINNYCYLSN